MLRSLTKTIQELLGVEYKPPASNTPRYTSLTKKVESCLEDNGMNRSQEYEPSAEIAEAPCFLSSVFLFAKDEGLIPNPEEPLSPLAPAVSKSFFNQP